MQKDRHDFPSEEYRLLNSLKGSLNYTPDSRYPIGIGDDAVIRKSEGNEQLLFTADILIEDVHFSFAYMSAEEIGYKAMVANLSDCAAMGAIPDSALVQVSFPDQNATQSDRENMLHELYRGFQKACVKWDFPIVGGDLSLGPCWIIAISLTGRKEIEGRILKRTGAEVGDDLWVTGVPGKSAAGFDVLKKWGRNNFPEEYRELVASHIVPYARVDTGLELADDCAVHAVIDLSDGISKECYTLCYENTIGIELSPGKECLLTSLEKLSNVLNKPWYDWFLYGGEDYELLFTASEDFKASQYTDNDLYKIGKITKRKNSVVFNDLEGHSTVVEKKAWDHFL